MVSYVHNLTTLWQIYHIHHQKVVQWSDAIFDEDRNAYTSCSMTLDEKENLQNPVGLPEADPTQVVYIEVDGTNEISTAACPRSGGDARQNGGSDARQSDRRDACQSSGSDIDTSVHTERRSESMHQEDKECPEWQPTEQPKPRNTSVREASKRYQLRQPTTQRASHRMTRTQRPQVLVKQGNIGIQNIEEDDRLTYAEGMTRSKMETWKTAIEEEYNCITPNEAFIFVNPIRAAKLNPMSYKSVHKTKQNGDKFECYKAH
ncbi:hypothetical protein BDD12DRAFT_883861 [Trichophaea hybrida]|nr:hypothetical protein BDD12DRAFT_883861 [Trichophaea hybrida]